ncbi:hypothetical protein [Amphritea sp.]|uniref:hypothetical protein n=1 Tax=Amphritea sp. TaxID=1872502 RepID=UPI003A932342
MTDIKEVHCKGFFIFNLWPHRPDSGKNNLFTAQRQRHNAIIPNAPESDIIHPYFTPQRMASTPVSFGPDPPY